MLGTQELLIILVIVLLLFGVKRLPQLGSSFGRSVSNFKKGLRGDEEAALDGSGAGEEADDAR